MKKIFQQFYVILLLITLGSVIGYSQNSIADQLQPYFDDYARRITLGDQEQRVLEHQYNVLKNSSPSLLQFLRQKFKNHSFANPEYIKAGGTGTGTETIGLKGEEGSDLDLNILVEIDQGSLTPNIDSYNLKVALKEWLSIRFKSTTRSDYVFNIKDPVVEVAADTILPNGYVVRYHMDIAFFSKVKDPFDCLNNPCAKIAWGAKPEDAKWIGNSSPYFIEAFDKRLPYPATKHSRDIGKALKLWNKAFNKIPEVEDSTPPSIAYLIALYEWYPNIGNSINQLKTIINSLRNQIFPNGCSQITSPTLNVPFYAEGNKNVLRKMNAQSLKKFCKNLRDMSKILDQIEQMTLSEALASLNQIFPEFYPPFPIEKGLYFIVNRKTGEYLSVEGSSYNDGANINVATSGNANIRWEVIPSPRDTYRIKSFNSNAFAVVQDASTEEGANIFQMNNAGFNALWGISNATSLGRMIVNYNSRKNMVVNGSGNVIQRSEFGKNGYWKFVKANYAAPKIFQDGTYTLKNVNSGKYIDVKGASTLDGANIIQKVKNSNRSQEWRVSPKKYGTFRLKNKNSKKYIVIKDGSTSEEAEVVQGDLGKGNSFFELIPKDNVTYKLKNITSGKYITVKNSSLSDGALIVQKENITTDGEWVFEKINTTTKAGIQNTNKLEIQKSLSDEVFFKTKLYPNPTSDFINVTTPLESQIFIYNINGKLMRQQEANSTITTIPVSSFSKGVYLLQIRLGNKAETKRFIVE